VLARDAAGADDRGPHADDPSSRRSIASE
jgi:hypothetical protein